MPYLFATEDQDYSDYAGGQVIYSRPGAPAFPVRLASEMFQRALAWLRPTGPLRLYDPCCGGAYHLCALGFLHGAWIASITASDIDEEILSLTRRNLRLLTPQGLEQRAQEIRDLLTQYGKESHAQALHSLAVLQARLAALPGGAIPSRVFRANALDGADLRRELTGTAVDLVLTDLPYGWMTGWQQAGDAPSAALPPAAQLLEALLPVLAPGAVVAVAADKSQKVMHAGYRRLEHFQIGKRQMTLLGRK